MPNRQGVAAEVVVPMDCSEWSEPDRGRKSACRIAPRRDRKLRWSLPTGVGTRNPAEAKARQGPDQLSGKLTQFVVILAVSASVVSAAILVPGCNP
jgi:hypothetical protein